jgi:Uma2 family endonuclease
MTSAPKLRRISVGQYLAEELNSPVKHEYVAGFVYAMAGARNVHNLIATNALVCLGTRLRVSRCRPYNSDTKIRLRLTSETRFYYPDVSVICRPNPQNDTFQDEPVLILEVVSPQSRRIDEGEKREGYLSIPSLCIYGIIEPDEPAVKIWRRSELGFAEELYQEMDSVIACPELDCELPLSEIYEGVELEPTLD